MLSQDCFVRKSVIKYFWRFTISFSIFVVFQMFIHLFQDLLLSNPSYFLGIFFICIGGFIYYLIFVEDKLLLLADMPDRKSFVSLIHNIQLSFFDPKIRIIISILLFMITIINFINLFTIKDIHNDFSFYMYIGFGIVAGVLLMEGINYISFISNFVISSLTILNYLVLGWKNLTRGVGKICVSCFFLIISIFTNYTIPFIFGFFSGILTRYLYSSYGIRKLKFEEKGGSASFSSVNYLTAEKKFQNLTDNIQKKLMIGDANSVLNLLQQNKDMFFSVVDQINGKKEYFINKARAHLILGEHEEIKRLFNLSKEENVLSDRMYYIMSLAYSMQRHYDKSIELVAQRINEKKDVSDNRGIGYLYLRLGDAYALKGADEYNLYYFDHAIENMKEAYKIYKKCPVTRNKLSHMLALRSLYTSSEDIFDLNYMTGGVKSVRYSSTRRRSDLETAYKLLQGTFELLANDNIVQHSNLFDISKIFINAKNLIYYDTYSFILYCLKDYNLSMKIASECFEVDTYNSSVHFHFGLYAEKSEKDFKAMYHYKKSVISGIHSPDNFCSVASYSNLKMLSKSNCKLDDLHFSSLK